MLHFYVCHQSIRIMNTVTENIKRISMLEFLFILFVFKQNFASFKFDSSLLTLPDDLKAKVSFHQLL